MDMGFIRRGEPQASGDGGLHVLQSPQQVRLIIHRERARADRSGREVSLVMLQPQDRSSRRMMQRLACDLLYGTRATDEVGWFDEQRLCAILPDTAPAGAACVAQRFGELAGGYSMNVRCVVYTYPTHWINGGNGDVAGAAPGAAPASPMGRPGGWARLRWAQLFGARPARQEHSPSGPFVPLEALLVHPLPSWKRGLDMIGAALGLVVCSPVMLAAALAIKLTSPGPVIFRQCRAGLGGRAFVIYKFRTMGLDAEQAKAQLKPCSEQDGPAFKLRNDPRVTSVGRLLRRTTIDELPQFWNVLKGDMSLVGPRPLPLEEANACQGWQRQRLDVTPGLTCIWQVQGRSRVCFNDWMRMDMRYIRRRSLLRDLKILLLTVPAVLLRRGAC